MSVWWWGVPFQSTGILGWSFNSPTCCCRCICRHGVCYDYTRLFAFLRGYKMEPNWKKKTRQVSLYLCSKHKMFFWLIIMKYHKWLRATATKSKTIFNIRHKCFRLVINNGNCCLAASPTAISSSNCQAFYLQLSSRRTHRGEAGFSPLNMPLLGTVWAAWTFLSTRLPVITRH